jgi:hypothetical protein
MKDGSAYVPPIRTQPIKMMTWSQNQSAIQPTLYGEGKLYMMIFYCSSSISVFTWEQLIDKQSKM